MTRIIFTAALLLVSTPVYSQQPWSAPPRTTAPPAVPASPNGVIMTPQGNIVRNGNFITYPNGATGLISGGLTTWSDGSGCRTQGNNTYCW